MAEKCRAVVSHWVRSICLFQGQLAVVFKHRNRPDVCCLYPGTTQRDYDAMDVWVSKGGYVWHVLPYHHPYQIIKDPCGPILFGVTTACCGNTLPANLHVSVNGNSAPLTFYEGPDPDLPVTFANVWRGQVSLGACGATYYMRFFCNVASSFELDGICNPPDPNPWQATMGSLLPDSVTCNPLSVQFTETAFGNCPTCGPSAIFTITT
jgi:hypothetical protein